MDTYLIHYNGGKIIKETDSIKLGKNVSSKQITWLH